MVSLRQDAFLENRVSNGIFRWTITSSTMSVQYPLMEDMIIKYNWNSEWILLCFFFFKVCVCKNICYFVIVLSFVHLILSWLYDWLLLIGPSEKWSKTCMDTSSRSNDFFLIPTNNSYIIIVPMIGMYGTITILYSETPLC